MLYFVFTERLLCKSYFYCSPVKCISVGCASISADDRDHRSQAWSKTMHVQSPYRYSVNHSIQVLLVPRLLGSNTSQYKFRQDSCSKLQFIGLALWGWDKSKEEGDFVTGGVLMADQHRSSINNTALSPLDPLGVIGPCLQSLWSCAEPLQTLPGPKHLHAARTHMDR